MLSEYLRRVHEFCFHAIGGEENEDVRSVLYDRPLEVTRADFFKESTWAIHASGVSRKVNAAFCDRATACGFPWDFGEVADWGQPGWNVFFGRLYPGGVSGRGGMKWRPSGTSPGSWLRPATTGRSGPLSSAARAAVPI